MTEDKVQQAMQIILHAGDARTHCMKALKMLENSDINAANEEIKLAQKEITEAHKLQTNAITEETQGKQSEYSVLFAHAQDTLMTIYSEINIAKRLIRIMDKYRQNVQSLEERISKLEKGE